MLQNSPIACIQSKYWLLKWNRRIGDILFLTLFGFCKIPKSLVLFRKVGQFRLNFHMMRHLLWKPNQHAIWLVQFVDIVQLMCQVLSMAKERFGFSIWNYKHPPPLPKKKCSDEWYLLWFNKIHFDSLAFCYSKKKNREERKFMAFFSFVLKCLLIELSYSQK